LNLFIFKNDKRRDEIDKLLIALTNKINSEKQRMQSAKSEIESLNEEILNLEKQKRNKNADFADISKKIKALQQKIQSLSPQSFMRRLTKLKDKVDELKNERNKLSENDKVFVYGGNSNDVIFALNRLPNQFQKNRAAKSALDTQRELKQIAALSPASPTVEKTIDSILDDNFPEELNTLFAKGISEFKGRGKELAKIKNWIAEKIQQLQQYENVLMATDDALGVASVNRQISELKELLNQLNLINLTAKNRIAKEQPYEQELNKIFGPESEEVQPSSSVSEVQSPTRGQTKTIPGETSGGQTQEISFDELKKIAKSEATELDFETELPTEVNPAVAEFANITDKAELELKKNQLQRSMSKNKLTLDQIYSAFNERMLELQEKVSINSITKGDIFQDINNFTGQDLPVQVVNVKENSVILKYGDTEVEITEDDLVNNFVKPTDTPVMEEPTKPSEELNNLAKDSKESFETFEKDKALQNKIIDDAEKLTEEELINKFKNNIKICE